MKLAATFVASIYLLIFVVRRQTSVTSYTQLPDALKLPPLVKLSQLYLLILAIVPSPVPETKANSLQGGIIPTWNILVLIVGFGFYLCCSCCRDYFWKKHNFKTGFLALLGTIDLLQAAGLAVGIAMQLTYLPGALAKCNSYHGPAAVEDMFKREAAARTAMQKLPKRPVTSRNVCRDFVAVPTLATYVMCVHDV